MYNISTVISKEGRYYIVLVEGVDLPVYLVTEEVKLILNIQNLGLSKEQKDKLWEDIHAYARCLYDTNQ